MSRCATVPADYLTVLREHRARLLSMVEGLDVAIRLYSLPLRTAEPKPAQIPTAAKAPFPATVTVAVPLDRTDDRVFSYERNLIIKREYPKGVRLDEIRTLLNELPGRQLQPDMNKRIAVQANALRLKRPAEIFSGFPFPVQAKPTVPVASAPKAAPVPMPVPQKPALVALAPAAERAPAVVPALGVDPADVRGKPGVWAPPVTKTWEAAKEIALRQRYRLTNQGDLPAFNRQRVAAGYPPLAIKFRKPSEYL